MKTDRLLELLREDAQLTPAQLAVMLGEKEEDVRKTIAALEKDGVIRGYHALVNWERSEILRDTDLI